jgi:hypothetical protein
MAKVTRTQKEQVIALLQDGKPTGEEITSRIGVSPSTFRALKAHVTRGTYTRAPGAAPPEVPRAVAKAIRTARWARTMVKRLITSVKSKRDWEIVNFTGRAGRESRGIVDLMAIRKDHRTSAVQRGDLFETILIQVKGGTARRPRPGDVDRLRLVADHYHARQVVLAEWRKGNAPEFFTLNPQRNTAPDDVWVEAANPKSLFA